MGVREAPPSRSGREAPGGARAAAAAQALPPGAVPCQLGVSLATCLVPGGSGEAEFGGRPRPVSAGCPEDVASTNKVCSETQVTFG